MFGEIKIVSALEKERKRFLKKDGLVIEKVNQILQESNYSEKNILRNLKSYNRTFEFLDEEGLDRNKIFSLNEIKKICIQYNLRFLDSQKFRGNIPSEAIDSIRELSKNRRTPLENFKILGPIEVFRKKNSDADPMLFAETNFGNYYLVHQWGHRVPRYTKLLNFPFRSIENLFGSLASVCIILSLITPQHWIMDTTKIEYWDAHRIALFFHLFIVFGSLTAFLMISFYGNFTSTKWDDDRP